MSVHLFGCPIHATPQEPKLLEALTVRLIDDCERERFDDELLTKHYLKNATVVGRVLRYVAEYDGQWVALLVFSSAAFHLKIRDQWLGWSPHQLKERRHLIAQNARFLVLASPGRWPNLATRVLKLVCKRLARDWQEHFGYPVQAVETFVDPQRFHGACYKAAGWEQLGLTKGCQRDWQDFYTYTEHPKQRPQLRAFRSIRTPNPRWPNTSSDRTTRSVSNPRSNLDLVFLLRAVVFHWCCMTHVFVARAGVKWALLTVASCKPECLALGSGFTMAGD